MAKNREPVKPLGPESGHNEEWSEEDDVDEEVEHAILTGMLDCIAKKKSNPLADPDALLDYMNKNLTIELSKNQLLEKIRRLEKFVTSKSKVRNLLKPPNEMEMFLLSENGKNEKGKETVAASPKANGSVESKWGKNEKGRRFWHH
ncbi:hypothetical protein ACJIZ3_009606 [Penstemon smallii]|uniref:Glabrous enhancer-binding protein-like DBD domain-containing protein n=1 Tax=Penstemon smallii TaxID=265156 RepID=A0ABD3TDT3_9LAMI